MINPYTTEQIIVRALLPDNIGYCQIYDTYRGHYMEKIPLNPKWVEDNKDKLSELNGKFFPPNIYYNVYDSKRDF